jgi:hypothetical protein
MAEQPVMDSATEQQTDSVAPMPKPYNKTEEAVNDLKNLLNLDASKNQEVASNESTKEVSDSEKNTDDTFENPELYDQIDEEITSENNQELYKVTVDGQDIEVTLNELMKGYSRQSDYTRKTKELSEDRKNVSELKNQLTRQSEEAKIKRDQYERQLQIFAEQLRASEPQVDMDRLYNEDPAEYVRYKAEQDRRKELLEQARVEQSRILSEKLKENDQQYQSYIGEQRKLLEEKLPIYADKEKGPEFVKNLVQYAKDIGYTDPEISMLVDHRAVMMLANAYRYDKLRKANVNNKKVTKVSKIVGSSSSKAHSDNDNVKRINSKKATLRRTGRLNDAVSILQEMYSR